MVPIPARYLQPVYAVPDDREAVAGRSEAIVHETAVVAEFFRSQLGGRHPRFAPDGEPVTVVTTRLPWSASTLEGSEVLANQIGSHLRGQRLVPAEATPVIYLEGSSGFEACGWTQPGQGFVTIAPLGIRAEFIVIAMDRCHITPAADSSWPSGATYLLAHETTHALGGTPEGSPHFLEGAHTGDDPRDVIYDGPTDRDWDHLMIDPGHDDYYAHGRADLVDIADSELLTAET